MKPMARGESSGTSPLQGEGLGATPGESIHNNSPKANYNPHSREISWSDFTAMRNKLLGGKLIK